MTPSGNNFPQRFTKVDDLTRSDHPYLRESDVCYFVGEYTARRGFSFSVTNQLIINFKKPMDRRNRREWPYKNQAIQMAATAFRSALRNEDLDRLTFVPVPPSKVKTDPLYDDRLTKMLHSIRAEPQLDVRELIVQTQSTEPAHSSESRPTIKDIEALYRIDDELTQPTPVKIAIVDDVLTTGAHFRAAKSLLSTRFPEAMIRGLFIARRVPNTSDFGEFDEV